MGKSRTIYRIKERFMHVAWNCERCEQYGVFSTMYVQVLDLLLYTSTDIQM